MSSNGYIRRRKWKKDLTIAIIGFLIGLLPAFICALISLMKGDW